MKRALKAGDWCPSGCDGYLSVQRGSGGIAYLYCPHCFTDYGPPPKRKPRKKKR